MSEWLDLMLEEVKRKKREMQEARDESARRAGGKVKPRQQEPDKQTGRGSAQ
jgi:hypothetical protein